MQFTMNAQDLLDGLNTVTRALAARPAKQILEGVLIETDMDELMLAIQEAYIDAKKRNKKYTPKKYRSKDAQK